MKRNICICLLAFFSISSSAQTIWVIDPVHSSIQFEVSHLAVSSVIGNFTSFSGTLTAGSEDFSNATINASIDATSIDTNNLERDKHLKDDDFFNTSQYPLIKFVGKEFKKIDENAYVLIGDLTIRNVTKPIELVTDFGGIVSISGKQKAGFTAKGSLNRFDYDLKWDDVLDNGGLIVGEKVDIILKIELMKQ